jgi:addiction module RelE/StbE family toxin
MNIEYHKNFIKNYKKRFGNNPKMKKQYNERLQLFIDNPKHPLLQNHTLRGERLTLRAFSITGDVRVVYTQLGRRVIFLDIGRHNQVY